MHQDLAVILRQFNYGKNSFIVLVPGGHWSWSSGGKQPASGCRQFNPHRARAKEERPPRQEAGAGSSLRCCPINAACGDHRPVTERLRGDWHDAKGSLRSHQASLRKPRDHHAGHSRHFTRKERRNEQSVETATHWEGQFQNVQSGRSSKRDWANLRVGQNASACCTGLRHNQSSVTADQNFAQPHPCLPPDFVSESPPKTHQIQRQVPKPEHERPDGGVREAVAVSAWHVGCSAAWEQSRRSQSAPLRMARRLLGSNTPPTAPIWRLPPSPRTSWRQSPRLCDWPFEPVSQSTEVPRTSEARCGQSEVAETEGWRARIPACESEHWRTRIPAHENELRWGGGRRGIIRVKICF